MQRALIQYKNPKNYDLVKEALLKAGREDLIGYDKKCLIRPRKSSTDSYSGKSVFVKEQSQKNKAPSKKKTIRNVHKKKGTIK